MLQKKGVHFFRHVSCLLFILFAYPSNVTLCSSSTVHSAQRRSVRSGPSTCMCPSAYGLHWLEAVGWMDGTLAWIDNGVKETTQFDLGQEPDTEQQHGNGRGQSSRRTRRRFLCMFMASYHLRGLQFPVPAVVYMTRALLGIQFRSVCKPLCVRDRKCSSDGREATKSTWRPRDSKAYDGVQSVQMACKVVGSSGHLDIFIR